MNVLKIIFKEFIGSLGDLGTFLPIALGLIVINKVDPLSLFLAVGLLYISAGVYFRIPLPVQPLKATSALAMAVGASAATISVVGCFVGVTLLCVRFLKFDKLMAGYHYVMAQAELPHITVLAPEADFVE